MGPRGLGHELDRPEGGASKAPRPPESSVPVPRFRPRGPRPQPRGCSEARLYNEALEKTLTDESNLERWRKHKARERYDEFGVKVGLQVGNEVTPVSDVLGILTFPPGFEVWEAGRRPPNSEKVGLPARPNIGATA